MELCEPKQLWLIIFILFLVVIALGAGKGLGALSQVLLKRILGHEMVMNVNVGGDPETMAGDRAAMATDRAILQGRACQIPEECPKHGEEHLRSVQNQKDIETLKVEAKQERDLFWKELRAIRKGVSCITNGLLAKQIIDPRDVPREE